MWANLALSPRDSGGAKGSGLEIDDEGFYDCQVVDLRDTRLPSYDSSRTYIRCAEFVGFQ